MRVLVTGGTGFLGRHLLSALANQGDEVIALVRQKTHEIDSRVRQVEGDVLDAASVEVAARGCESLYHCAGKVSRRTEDAEMLYRLHVEGTKLTLGAAKKAGIRRVVLASSSGTIAVSDDPDFIATETHTPPLATIARWPYYRSKYFAEMAALERNEEGFEVLSVNPTLLLGPGDINGSSTEDVRLFLEKKIPATPAGGMSYVDVRDAADAMRLAMEKGRAGEKYLVGACNLTLSEFFGRLERVSGVRAPKVPLPRAPVVARVGAEVAERLLSRLGMAMPVDPVSFDMAQFYWYLDATKAERELGWVSRDPLETLYDTVEDLRARGIVWPETFAENEARA
jgi:dihydroflavonol-4-reductase